MCGRYTLTVDIENIFSQFGINLSDDFRLKPQYNIAPSRQMPIITTDYQPMMLTWGINHGKHFVINTRLEGKLRHRRDLHSCLIPADGFYEWRNENGKKQPYYFSLSNKWFMFAGLYQLEQSGFTILTTVANKQIEPYHHRMPVILSNKQQYTNWLKQGLTPDNFAELEIKAVNKNVNNSRYNQPDCIEPQTQQQMSFSIES